MGYIYIYIYIELKFDCLVLEKLPDLSCSLVQLSV